MLLFKLIIVQFLKSKSSKWQTLFINTGHEFMASLSRKYLKMQSFLGIKTENWKTCEKAVATTTNRVKFIDGSTQLIK